MRVFVKTGRDIERQMSKKIAPLSARKDLQENISRELSNIKNGSIQDKAQAAKEARKWQNTYDRNCPETLSPEAKNAMWKRAKQLKDEFVVGMLSTDELHPVSMTQKDGVIRTVVDAEKMRSVNSVQRQLAWEKKNNVKVKEYKNILRHLCPDNPDATDITKFAPKGRIS